MNPFLNIAIQACRNGAKQLLQSMDRIDRLNISKKANNELVSTADTMSEFAIIETLQKYYPDIPILSEEAGLIEGDNEEYRWILDPLDGTNNYLRQIPHFAISLALKQNGKTIIAVVYDPVKDELYSALKGHGAYCNSKRIRIRDCSDLSQAYLSIGRNNDVEIASILMQKSLAYRRFGAAALDLCYLAAGRVDGYWSAPLKEWDVTAAELVVKEAGGIIANIKQQFFAGPPKLLHNIISQTIGDEYA